jgi:hypothetical protein
MNGSNCFEDVVECLRWYSYRWLIERYHYVLIHRLSPRTIATGFERSHPESFSKYLGMWVKSVKSA